MPQNTIPNKRFLKYYTKIKETITPETGDSIKLIYNGEYRGLKLRKRGWSKEFKRY